MNKAELIEHIADAAGITKSAAAKAVEAMVEGITNSLKKDESVSISGFGTFSVSHRPERQGRNPQTGETITIKASNSPKFKAGKALKDALN